MPTALHPQTQMTFKFDGEILPRKYGFPMKVRMPTKLGFKNPKHVMEIAVTDKYLGGYWEDQGYNWFSGL
jgi:DMSO/TMAO reductase YedYZ molybdopterin-dependent catalytic subunit